MLEGRRHQAAVDESAQLDLRRREGRRAARSRTGPSSSARRTRCCARACARPISRSACRSPSKASARAAAGPIANASSVLLADGRGFYTGGRGQPATSRRATPAERSAAMRSEHDTGTRTRPLRFDGGARSRVGCLLAGATAASRVPRFRARADGKPDFSGIWQSTERRRLRPRAARGPRGRAARAPASSTAARSPTSPGRWSSAKANSRHAPRPTRGSSAGRSACRAGVYFPRRSRSSSATRDLTLVGQFGAVRTIHTNGTRHPEGPFEFWLGDSRATVGGRHARRRRRRFQRRDLARPRRQLPQRGAARRRALDAPRREHDRVPGDARGPEGVHARRGRSNVLLHRQREQDFQLIENYCFTLEYDEYYPFTRTDSACAAGAPDSPTHA